MPRMIVLTAVAVLTLALAPAAVAKEISAAKVCGPEGCTAVAGEDDRMALMTSGSPTDPPTRAPYYEVAAEFRADGHRETVTFVAVPEHGTIRYSDGNWYTMTAEQTALIDKLTADRTAFPAAGLVGAAEPPAPQPAPAPASDSDSLLWPEGVLLALALGVAGVFLVRSSRRFLPARFARGEGSRG